MGDTISSLVFRPPRPTPIHPSDYFYLDVDVHTPLCANRAHGGRSGSNRDRNGDGGTTGNGGSNGDCCPSGGGGGGDGGDYEQSIVAGGCFVGGAMCLDTGESDLAMLDTSFIGNGKGAGMGGCYTGEMNACTKMNNSSTAPDNNNDGDDASDDSDAVVPNVRNGRVYRVPAFFIRRRNATKTILFSHGNAEDLGMMYARMKDLALVLGVNVLAYDYTGYGLSMPGPAYRNRVDGSSSGIGVGGVNQNGNDGSAVAGGTNGNGSGAGNNEGPSENMTYRNIEAAYRYLTRVRKIPPRDIILYGRSLGSGPSWYLAAKTSLTGNPVGGLILHSPFLSVYKVVADLNGLDLGMVGDLFNNEKRARNVRCPTMIIHGREDEVVPFWHAPRLLAAIPPEYRARPYYVDGMGHNHIESRCREQYVRLVSNFLSMVMRDDNGAMPGDGGFGGCRVVPVVPVHERASPCEAGEENPTFYLNKTWIRHARILLGEVFADVGGCYVNNSVDTRANGRSAQGGGGTSRRGKVMTTNAAGTTATSLTTRHPNNTAEGRSDVRDDEDEFAPWRNENLPRRRHQQQQQQQMAESSKYCRYHSTESILITRPNVSNSANIRASSGSGRNAPNYRKSHSATALLTPSGARRALSPTGQDKNDQQRRRKSMVLAGLSRSKRY